MDQCSNLNIVIIGLSLTSSWGNGHATTYRSLIKGLHKRGHRVLFLEKDVPWYSSQRDVTDLPFCQISLYKTESELFTKYKNKVARADCVIMGSFVSNGVITGQWVQKTAQGVKAFYDIDTPVTLSKLRSEDHEYLTPGLIPGYDLYLSFTGGPVLNYIMEKYKAPKAFPFYCSVDPENYFHQPQELKWDLGYMGTFSQDRQPGLEELLIKPARNLSHKNFVVAGPQYPAVSWPKNIKRIEHISPEQHRPFYNSQRYTLNITRADMKKAGYSPSVRLFEAAACSTAIISDDWPGLDSYFTPGEEILIARDAHEITEILLKQDEVSRTKIGHKARLRILNQHTGENRAIELENYINLVTKNL
jgi:spore maturation protein CgeB